LRRNLSRCEIRRHSKQGDSGAFSSRSPIRLPWKILFSDTRERLSEYLFYISDLAFQTAGCASAIVDSDAGEHARRQLQHAAVTAENYVHDSIGISFDGGVHGSQLVGKARFVDKF